jgi:type I restriction-modification system DNA methylase subunit
MDASEYKHVVLGLMFLKYISDAFQAKYEELEAIKKTEYTDPEDRDEYMNTFSDVSRQRKARGAASFTPLSVWLSSWSG